MKIEDIERANPAVRAERVKRAARIARKPLRTCRYLHECALCLAPITAGQRYHDGGYWSRAHETCIRALLDAPDEGGERG